MIITGNMKKKSGDLLLGSIRYLSWYIKPFIHASAAIGIVSLFILRSAATNGEISVLDATEFKEIYHILLNVGFIVCTISIGVRFMWIGGPGQKQ